MSFPLLLSTLLCFSSSFFLRYAALENFLSLSRNKEGTPFRWSFSFPVFVLLARPLPLRYDWGALFVVGLAFAEIIREFRKLMGCYLAREGSDFTREWKSFRAHAESSVCVRVINANKQSCCVFAGNWAAYAKYNAYATYDMCSPCVCVCVWQLWLDFHLVRFI